MFTPLSVAGGLVVDSGQELEVLEGNLLGLDAQLVLQLAARSSLDAINGVGQVGAGLTGDSQGVRAARVGPHVGEGDLLGGTLLEQELVLVVEEEDGEGAVEETLVNVGHQVACEWPEHQYEHNHEDCRSTVGGGGGVVKVAALRTDLLAGLSDGKVVLVGDNAHLVHETDLLLVVAGESIAAGVDVGEQAEHVLGRDGLGRGGGRRHGEEPGWGRDSWPSSSSGRQSKRRTLARRNTSKGGFELVREEVGKPSRRHCLWEDPSILIITY